MKDRIAKVALKYCNHSKLKRKKYPIFRKELTIENNLKKLKQKELFSYQKNGKTLCRKSDN